jgi:hypothetical protein
MKDLTRTSAAIRALKRHPGLTQDDNGQLNVALQLVERLRGDDLLLEERVDDAWKMTDMLMSVLERCRRIREQYQDTNVVIFEPVFKDDPEAVEAGIRRRATG